MSNRYLSSDFTTEPYWTDGLEPFRSPVGPSDRQTDVAVVGGGLTGLSCALTLARSGCGVTIFEAGAIGDGAVARSAGSLSHVPKASLADLTTAYGRDTALSVYREARIAREYVELLIRTHQIDCGLQTVNRFLAAHSETAFARQRGNLESLRESWGDVELVPREDQRRMIGSDAFFGGIKMANSATLQPARLQGGLAHAAVSAGAKLLLGTRVLDVRGVPGAFEIVTPDASYRARHVVLAMGAATGLGPSRFSALARRLIVVPAYCAATEEVSPELLNRVLPVRGPVSDTYKIVNYIAPSENGRRFILSGRAGRADGGLAAKAERMFGYFAARFPDLRHVKVTHCWTGRFAISADWIPHVGLEDGIHYALGCCGTGIPMATWLGHQIGLKILGHASSVSAFERPLPPIPFHAARTLMLPLAVRGYALRDRLLR